MSYRLPARAAADRCRVTVLAATVVVSAALIGVLVDRSSATSSDQSRAIPTATAGTTPPPMARGGSFAPGPPDRLPRDRQGALSEADGVVPVAVTVFDTTYPAVAKLDPALLDALRRAANDAQRHGVEFYVGSGWRSPKYQEQLLSEAIAKYGSDAEVARWVATPDTSAHVSGDAVDIRPSAASAWLSNYGADYGLCQIYRNEPWHYELRPGATAHGCPATYADPAHDPRMQP